MPSAGFEFSLPVSERQQIHALEQATAEIGLIECYISLFAWKNWEKSYPRLLSN